MKKNSPYATNNLCSMRRTTESQRIHLEQIVSARSSIDTSHPYQPTHSLSKWTNKYSIEQHQKIDRDNKALLQKMIEIDKKDSQMSPRTIRVHTFPVKSMAEYLRKKGNEQLALENTRIIDRIGSATKRSCYGKESWLPDAKRSELYKSNIMRSRIMIPCVDYTQLSRTNLFQDHNFLIRKIGSVSAGWA